MKNFVVPIISQLNIENYNTSHALHVVPRGSRDGELVNKRRATRDHEAGNECPNREPQFGQYKKS